MYPSSVVQTGVKFFGCENRMAQPFPIHSWKLIRPCVVSAVKLGASLLILNAITHLPIVWNRQTIVRSRCPTFAANEPQCNLADARRHQERGHLHPAKRPPPSLCASRPCDTRGTSRPHTSSLNHHRRRRGQGDLSPGARRVVDVRPRHRMRRSRPPLAVV